MSDQTSGEDLQSRLGYQFRDARLFQAALTHKSFANEQSDSSCPYNERLEFLGDAVLSLVVSEFVFEQFSSASEGEMSRIRSEVVSEAGLAIVARDLELGRHLIVGRGEERSGARDKCSLLANALEALFGAVFRDGGFALARELIRRLFAEIIAQSARCTAGSDHKTRLQEYFQGRFGRPPAYHLVEVSGPDHDRTYRIEALFDAEVIGSGVGRTKKSAEQAAAATALQAMENERIKRGESHD